MHTFIFNGTSSNQFGLHIRDYSIASSPSLKINQQYVPGRNGALLLSEVYYENRVLKYDVWAKVKKDHTKAEQERSIKNWLLGTGGSYYHLEDSLDSMFVYKAAYVSGMEFISSNKNMIETSLTFTAKPFQYHKWGLERITISNGIQLVNPTPYTALPYIRIYGNGNITLIVNNAIFNFFGVNEYIEIDSELMNVYKGTQNANSQKQGDGFPILNAGTNGIKWAGNVTKVQIETRWRSL